MLACRYSEWNECNEHFCTSGATIGGSGSIVSNCQTRIRVICDGDSSFPVLTSRCASSPRIREQVFVSPSVPLRSITSFQHALQKQDPSFASQPQIQQAIFHDVGPEIKHTNSSTLSHAPDQDTFLTRSTLASVNPNPATQSAPSDLLRAPSCRQDVPQLVPTLFLPMTGLLDFTHGPMATRVSSRSSHMAHPFSTNTCISLTKQAFPLSSFA